jgi:acetyl esterase/lipase
MSDYPAPPFDPELIPALEQVHTVLPTTFTLESMIEGRDSPGWAMADQLVAGRGLVQERRVIPGAPGDPDVVVGILRRPDHVAGGPGIYSIHGGGMIQGDERAGYPAVVDWIAEFDAVAVSVDYRLAPEHPDPAPINDSYAGLVWMAAHADELGFDVNRLLITGLSAGGGLAAGVTLMARDLGGPALVGQLLSCPMLDDRNETVSTRQMDGIGMWDRGSSEVAWTAYLGDRYGTDDVSVYAAPTRAADLSNLPPTFIDVGSADLLRDESVAYASRIWEAGGDAECHVFAGAYHGYELMVPDAVVSRATMDARLSFVRRVFAR